MATETRKSGIDVVGDVAAWGAHFCLFYETKEDLLETLISYCKSGVGKRGVLPLDRSRALHDRRSEGRPERRGCPTSIDTLRALVWRWRQPETFFCRVADSMASD